MTGPGSRRCRRWGAAQEMTSLVRGSTGTIVGCRSAGRSLRPHQLPMERSLLPEHRDGQCAPAWGSQTWAKRLYYEGDLGWRLGEDRLQRLPWLRLPGPDGGGDGDGRARV